MAQNDLIISNQLFPATRQDINDAFESVATQQSGATEPATKYAYQTYADTTNGVLKRRNSLNTDYLIRDTLSDTLVDAKTTTYTVIASDFSKFLTLDTTTGDATINLPPASTVGAGFYIDFQKIVNLNNVVIDPDSTETINGQSTYTVYCKDSGGRIICNGSNWNLLLTPGPVIYEYDYLSANIVHTNTQNSQNIMQVNGILGRTYQLSYSFVWAVIARPTLVFDFNFEIEEFNTTNFLRDLNFRIENPADRTDNNDNDDSMGTISDTLIYTPISDGRIAVDMLSTKVSDSNDGTLTMYGNGTNTESFLGLLDVSDTHRAGDLDA